MTDAFEALRRFRQAVLTDPEAQQALAAEEIGPRFAQAAAAWAASRGIPITAEALDTLASAPARHLPPTELSTIWPPPQWLPISVDVEGVVDWCHFAQAPLLEPFFDDSAHRARLRPFNRLVKWRTGLVSLAPSDPNGGSPPPSGFIFHMSRCGSTLVAQMLAAVAQHIVVSEPPPLDAIIQRAAREGNLSDEATVQTLRAMVAALGRDRTGDASGCFLKLDAWHAAAIPLFRQAFPDTPWIFLHRNPIEVMVSQARLAGTHTVPGLIEKALIGGASTETAISGPSYTAAILRAICAAAVEAAPLGGGMFVNYRELPDALFTRILPHFGVSPSPAKRELMAAASKASAKQPGAIFAPDAEDKQREASDDIRAAAASLADVHAALDALSSQASPSTASLSSSSSSSRSSIASTMRSSCS